MSTDARAAPLVTLTLAVSMVLSSPSRALEAELVLPSGKAVTGEARMSAGRLRVGGADADPGHIVSLRLSELPANGMIDQGVALRAGDVIAGIITEVQAGTLAFVSDSLGAVKIPLDQVKAIALTPRRIADMNDPSQRSAEAVLTNGDAVAGRLEWINEDLVGIFTGRRIVRIPRARTGFIRLDSPEAPALARADGTSRQFVRLLSGDRISGTLTGLDDRVVEIDTSHAGRVTLSTAVVQEVWSEGGSLTPLGTLQPTTARHVPQFDESFPHRVDRSVLGGLLTVGGRVYDRGLGCHSRSELEYELDRGFVALVAEIGVDDGAFAGSRERSQRGEVVFQVFADEQLAFDGGVVRGGQAARRIHVRLDGARRMRLVVDFGPDGLSFGDHADWCQPVLVRR